MVPVFSLQNNFAILGLFGHRVLFDHFILPAILISGRLVGARQHFADLGLDGSPRKIAFTFVQSSLLFQSALDYRYSLRHLYNRLYYVNQPSTIGILCVICTIFFTMSINHRLSVFSASFVQSSLLCQSTIDYRYSLRHLYNLLYYVNQPSTIGILCVICTIFFTMSTNHRLSVFSASFVQSSLLCQSTIDYRYSLRHLYNLLYYVNQPSTIGILYVICTIFFTMSTIDYRYSLRHLYNLLYYVNQPSTVGILCIICTMFFTISTNHRLSVFSASFVQSSLLCQPTIDYRYSLRHLYNLLYYVNQPSTIGILCVICTIFFTISINHRLSVFSASFVQSSLLCQPTIDYRYSLRHLYNLLYYVNQPSTIDILCVICTIFFTMSINHRLSVFSASFVQSSLLCQPTIGYRYSLRHLYNILYYVNQPSTIGILCVICTIFFTMSTNHGLSVLSASFIQSSLLCQPTIDYRYSLRHLYNLLYYVNQPSTIGILCVICTIFFTMSINHRLSVFSASFVQSSLLCQPTIDYRYSLRHLYNLLYYVNQPSTIVILCVICTIFFTMSTNHRLSVFYASFVQSTSGSFGLI